MLKNIIFFPIKVLRKVELLGDSLYNKMILKYNRVIFSDNLTIKGRIVIANKGTFKIGKNVTFNCSVKSNFVGLFKPCTVEVEKDGTLEIGDFAGLSGVSIMCSKKITIGKYVNCGGNVCVWDTDFHPLFYLERRVDDKLKVLSSPIFIGDDVFIGANSIILKGVTIGNRSVVGAGSIVTKSIPADEIWAGNPAKLIRKIDS